MRTENWKPAAPTDLLRDSRDEPRAAPCVSETLQGPAEQRGWSRAGEELTVFGWCWGPPVGPPLQGPLGRKTVL